MKGETSNCIQDFKILLSTQMFQLMGKEAFTILCSKVLFNWTCMIAGFLTGKPGTIRELNEASGVRKAYYT